MRRAARWVAFMVILAMTTAVLLASTVAALAVGTTASGGVLGSTASPAMSNVGKIEAVVWDDGIISSVSDCKQEGVDGITVELYSKDSSGNWRLYGSKKSGAGGGIAHGWVGWDSLPVVADWSTTTQYKLVLVNDGSFVSLNGAERVASLNISNWFYRWFFEVTGDTELSAFKIKASPALLGLENKGKIEAAVWDDSILPDVSDSKLEGMDGITVNLYGRDESGAWTLRGSQKTGAGGFTWAVLNGWVGWKDLPVFSDARMTTEYKLELVTDGTFEPLNGTERIARLDASNNHMRWFFDNGDSAELPAFKIRYTAPLPTENLGKIESVVWDDAVLAGVKDSKQEGVNGITVNLYSKDSSGAWQFYGSKKTGAGGFTWVVERGWVGWSELPVSTDWRRTTEYRLELVTDNTFVPQGGIERVARLNWSNLYYRWFFEVAENAELRAFQIKSTTVLISGVAWSDANADQVRQWAEPVLSGWTVVLTNSLGRRIASTTTDARGYYQFRGLSPGAYRVWITEKRSWKQVYPYYKLFTWPPFNCEKGHHVIAGQAGKYYVNNDFGMLSMRDSIWATLYYGLWWFGLLQYQFE